MILKSEILKKSKEIHNNKYSYNLSSDIFIMSDKIDIICPIHKIFKQSINHHINRKQGCPKCKGDKISNTKKIKIDDIIKRSKELYNDLYIIQNLENLEYKNIFSKINIKCSKHNLIFNQSINTHLKGYKGCKQCVKEIKKIPIPKNQKTSEEFIEKHKKYNFDENYDYSKVKYINNRANVEIVCLKHGSFFTKNPKIGCQKCKNHKNFIEKSKIIHNYKYDYSKVRYINNFTKVEIICSKSGHPNFFQQPSNHTTGKGCPICNSSKGELYIHNYLTNKKISFIKEKKFDDCKFLKVLKFDFYLPQHNMCIEFDGLQHFKSINYFGGLEGLKTSQKRDKIKNNYCKANNIKLIRIKYNENIENILSNIFID